MGDPVGSAGDVTPQGGSGTPINSSAALDALARAVVVTHPDGIISHWNRAAELLYGWAAAEVIGRSVLEVLAPPDRLDENSQDLRAVAGGKQMAGDRLVSTRDGTIKRIHTSTAPVLDEDGNTLAIVGTAQDVGELRLAEQRTRDLAEQYRLALDAGGLGTWRWDAKSGETVWDERLESLFGMRSGSFDGSYDSYVSMLHPEDRDSVLSSVAEAMESRSTYLVEHRIVWSDGSVHWIEGAGGVTLDEQGEVTGTVGCAMDVTDRAELKQEQLRLTEIAVLAADDERLQRERLEFLAQINEVLNESDNVQEVMERVARHVVPRLGDWCTIHVLPADGSRVPTTEVAHVDPTMVAYARELQAQFPYDPDAPSGVSAVIRTGTTEFYPKISDDVLDSLDMEDAARELVQRLDLASAVTVAMKKRGRVVGAIQFVATTRSRPYTADDVALAETLAGRVASSIENLRLYEQQRTIAHTLQRSLLPAALPEIPFIDTAVRYWPNGETTEVGGDFYDMFRLDDGGVAVVLGDVCGTGPSAAALTGLARHTVRTSAWHGDGPEDVLHSLNCALRRSDNDTFLTCAYARIEMTGATATVTVACGGHPLPVHVTRTGATAVGRPGTLLGVFDDVVVPPTTIELAPGDVMVFHTDGATDVPPPHDLDEVQWTALVAEAALGGATADDIADRIRASIEALLPFASRHDDIALLVLKITSTDDGVEETAPGPP